jgi:hypothetical protein
MFRGPISKLARAGRSAKRNVRSLHVEAHTLEHPTPEAVSALIPSDLADSKGTVLFSLSTSTPGSDIPALVSTVGKNSVGSFHISGIPTLSLAILRPEEGETLSTFYDSTVGRAPVQVGKWQRLGTSWTDDKRGAGVGELANVLGTGGWEEVWRGEEAAAGVDVPER